MQILPALKSSNVLHLGQLEYLSVSLPIYLQYLLNVLLHPLAKFEEALEHLKMTKIYRSLILNQIGLFKTQNVTALTMDTL